MKTLLVVLTLAAFALAAPLAMAADQPGKPGAKPMVINCCKSGKCSQVKAEADCTKGGGKVVKDCKACK